MLFKSFPGTTMLLQRQYSLFRDRDVCYSNIFQAPLGCHKDRISLSGIDMFVSRIFSRRHYAATTAEFPFQGYLCLLFESFAGATVPPQRQSSPFRGFEVCYLNLFQAPLCCHKDRIPLSGIETFVIQIFFRRTRLPQRQNFPVRDRYVC